MNLPRFTQPLGDVIYKLSPAHVVDTHCLYSKRNKHYQEKNRGVVSEQRGHTSPSAQIRTLPRHDMVCTPPGGT